MPTPSPTATVIDYAKFTQLEARLRKRRGSVSKDDYKIWERFDSAIREVMQRHGRSVGWEADVDFYHGGDWFHELYDGFALMTPTALSVPLLDDLQVVVAQHHADAVLAFGGEVETPMTGLALIVIPSEIYAAWYANTSDTCRRKSREQGFAYCNQLVITMIKSTS